MYPSQTLNPSYGPGSITFFDSKQADVFLLETTEVPWPYQAGYQ